MGNKSKFDCQTVSLSPFHMLTSVGQLIKSSACSFTDNFITLNCWCDEPYISVLSYLFSCAVDSRAPHFDFAQNSEFFRKNFQTNRPRLTWLFGCTVTCCLKFSFGNTFLTWIRYMLFWFRFECIPRYKSI